MSAPSEPIKLVIFRCDAALHIGAGHVMRCLTLANALREQGAKTVFVCRAHTGHLEDFIIAQGHECFLLPAANNPVTKKLIAKQPDVNNTPPHAAWLGESWQTDAEQTQQLLTGRHFDWLVVDHYALDAKWEHAVRVCTDRIMVIDDLADRQHDCDLLLDQTLGRTAVGYSAWVPAACRLLTGASYALLRPEFIQWRACSLARRHPQPALTQLLINLGGVDNSNLTGNVLEIVNTIDLPTDLEITVVMGMTAPHLAEVETLARQMPVKTQVKVNVSNIAELMANSDLAIGAAGTTSWERCCLGLPTLLFVLAPNQMDSASALQTAGAVMLIKTLDDLAGAVRTVCESPTILATMSHAAAGLVRGDGVTTVVSKVKELM